MITPDYNNKLSQYVTRVLCNLHVYYKPLTLSTQCSIMRSVITEKNLSNHSDTYSFARIPKATKTQK